MDGIDTFDKLVDAKKQLNDTFMKIQTVNLFSARQNDALDASNDPEYRASQTMDHSQA